MFTPALLQSPDQLPSMPDPYGTAGTLAQRARAWLHTNCSQCHRPGGPTSVNMDLRYTTALASTNACDVLPVNALGIANARRIAIGGADPAARSLVIQRASLTDSNSMPPFQPRLVDTAGVQLLTDWVSSLTSCN
jgi:mono/diheme cytochrome c family protein